MKIFITGVAGFLGSHLADALLALGYEVSGCDNMEGGYLDNVPTGVEFHQVDCNNYEAILLLTKVDIVYNLASSAHEGLSIFSPHHYSKNTYGSTMSVLSASLANGVKRFVQCSSAARYGAIETPFTEDMLPKPQDPYGIAKYAADLSVIDSCQTHGMEYAIAVPHNIIGTRQKYDDPYRNAISIFTNLMLQGRSPTIYGDGSQKRCFSFVSDIVNPLVLLGTMPEANGEIFNLGPDTGEVTIKEVVEMLADIIGFKGEINYVPERPKEVKDVLCSADKARRVLGYEAKKDLREGLEEIVAWIKERGTKPFDYHLPVELPDSPLFPVTWKEKRF
jgi:UDP-glucose 4-epimerase